MRTRSRRLFAAGCSLFVVASALGQDPGPSVQSYTVTPTTGIYEGQSLTATMSASGQVVLLEGAGLSWREARRIIEEHGGQLVHVLPPAVLVGEIPEGAVAALQDAASLVPEGPGLRVVRTPAEARSLLVADAASPGLRAMGMLGDALSIEARAALRLLAPEVVPIDRDPLYRVLPDGRVEVRPIEDWEEPPLVAPKWALSQGVRLQAVGNTFYNTSDFLAGDVAVAILRPESNGLIDPSTEDWTSGEVTYSLTQILGALDKLRNDSPRGKLTFVYRTESLGPGVAGTVSCDYEAILYSNWTSAIVLDFLGKLGYTQASPYDRLNEWANDVRTDLGTDWAFGIIVVDNSSDTTRGRASAYVTGPAGWLFQNYTPSVYHHEMGHIWGATDEYHPDAAKSPTLLYGYTQEVNANSQYNDGTGYFGGAGESILALMINNVDYVSPWTRGQWGTWDLDGDGINDTQDNFPTVVLNAPTGSSTLAFTGTASVTPLEKETGAFASTDISVNRISGVEWRVSGGPWQAATASDGTFDESSETFTFTTPDLKSGTYLFEARAADHFGNVTTLYPRRDVSVSGSAVSNNVPMPALVVTPTLGSAATTFLLDATGSLDTEDGSALQYRLDYENDGGWDTAFSSNATASRTYGVAGSKTARVEVRDSAGATSIRTASFTVSAAPVAPTATFTMDSGAGFMTSPAIFNFDASGVSDGEDAAADLEVRWDFEDDGIWDTDYSTTKTASHDYAQGYAADPAVESGNSHLYAGNQVNGFAQSFLAASTGIGRVALFLKHYNDNTPGGTVTVGLRSSLTGAWLSSLARNQADLKEGDWNLFDVPDITVTNGGTYYLVLIASDTDMMWLADTSNPYAGGSHHYSLNGGASWGTNTSYDHSFRIHDSMTSTVPLTKSRAWRARMEVKDTGGQTAQTTRDFWTNAYDTPPTVSLGASPTSGTTSTTFNLTATGDDADLGTVWDGLLHYRWDVDGDGNFETEFGTSSTRSTTFSQAGTYQATVEVRDRYHATARASVALTVAACTSLSAPILTAPTSRSSGAAYSVSWTATSPNGTYELQEATDSGFTSPTTSSVTGTNRSLSHTVGSPTTYYYRARATDACGESTFTSSWSNTGQTTVTVPSYTLSVSKTGAGTGTVTSVPAAISCGSTCSASFNQGAVLNLIATPAAGSAFAGWSGSCAGTGVCQVTMTAGKSATATFNDVSGCTTTVADQAFTGAQLYESCHGIYAGPNVSTTTSGGHLTLRAAAVVVLRNGFSIGNGAKLTVALDPSLAGT